MTDKDFFDIQGHLTDTALDALIDETADELQRLEIAEHLSFCDHCLERYTSRLTGEALVVPACKASSISVTVRKKSGAEHEWSFSTDMATMAVAACFALILWVSGAFVVNANRMEFKLLDAIQSGSQQFSQATNSFSEKLSDILQNLINKFDAKGASQHAQK